MVPKSDTGNQNRNQVIIVDLPRVSSKMYSLSNRDTLILPTCISVTETRLGNVAVSIVNSTEMLAADGGDEPVLYLAKEITQEIGRIVERLEESDNVSPDLITSWT